MLPESFAGVKYDLETFFQRQMWSLIPIPCISFIILFETLDYEYCTGKCGLNQDWGQCTLYLSTFLK